MKILHVVPSLDQMYGGPLRSVIDLSSESRAYGLESEIAGFGEFNIPDCRLPLDAFHSFPLDQPSVLRYSRSFKPWLEKNLKRFDGVVINCMWQYPNWATYLACREAGVKYVCFPHGMLDSWSVGSQGWLKRLKKTAYWYARENKIFSGAECVFYATERERTLSSASFKPMKRDRVIFPSGISTPREQVHQPARSELQIPSGTKAALFLGRVHPKKNVHFLVETWCQAQIPENWELIIAGPVDDIYLNQLKHIAKQHPRGEKIRFVGAVSGVDKTYLLQASSWFLLPSKMENFGVAVLEALSHQCPIVISPEVYLADEMHSESEVLPLEKGAWVEFFEKRMADETWRARLRFLDEELLKPKFRIDHVARSWTDALTEFFTGAVQQPSAAAREVFENVS